MNETFCGFPTFEQIVKMKLNEMIFEVLNYTVILMWVFIVERIQRSCLVI